MANVEITWTVSGKSRADVILGYDPSTVDADGNAVVTSASGTYQVLDAANNVVRTDQVTGLIAANSFLFAPDDKVNVDGRSPIVDTSGLGVLIDNAADADQIGPNNTPEVELSTDIFGDYRELQKGDAIDVKLQQTGSTGTGTTGTGTTGSGSTGTGSTGTGTTSSGGVTVTTGPDGHSVVDISAPGQTVTSMSFDTFRNHGSPDTTFVFTQGHGLDIVHQFRVDGPDHDTMSFVGSDFGNTVTEVLQNTRNRKGGAVIVDPTTGDAVRLTGITKGELEANKQDFTFHA